MGEITARIERKHEVIDGPLTEELLRCKAEDGWRALAVVWERTVEGEEEDASTQAVPFGLRVASDCMTLEPAVDEIKAMIHMLKMIVDDKGFAQIASELNEAGLLDTPRRRMEPDIGVPDAPAPDRGRAKHLFERRLASDEASPDALKKRAARSSVSADASVSCRLI